MKIETKGENLGRVARTGHPRTGRAVTATLRTETNTLTPTHLSRTLTFYRFLVYTHTLRRELANNGFFKNLLDDGVLRDVERY